MGPKQLVENLLLACGARAGPDSFAFFPASLSASCGPAHAAGEREAWCWDPRPRSEWLLARLLVRQVLLRGLEFMPKLHLLERDYIDFLNHDPVDFLTLLLIDSSCYIIPFKIVEI